MIQALVFDCFGVLATDGWLPFKHQHFGHDPELLEAATSLNKQSDAGLISYDDFVAGVARLAGVTGAEVKRAIEDNVPNQALFAALPEFKQQYKIGLLSNAASDWLSELFTAEQLALFDATALSCQTGFIKPQAQAYQAIADKLGVPLKDCVLIDDQERYCSGAREAGMQTIWYKNTEQALAELHSLLQ